MSAISIDAVSRAFTTGGRTVQALDEVSFTADEGQVVALLGENGAGKTTLTKIVGTLLLPSAGRVTVLGVDVEADPISVRRTVSIIFGGDRGLYGRLTARQNLRYFAVLAGVPRRGIDARLDEALRGVGLDPANAQTVFTFSRGMKQRLHIALGLITEPRVLLLDEPTIGLDPLEAARLRDTIRRLRQTGVTVLLTSHYLQDVQELADRVVLLHKGRVTHDMAIAEFASAAGGSAVIEVVGRGPVPAVDAWRERIRVDLETDGEGWTLRYTVPEWNADLFARLHADIGAAEIVDLRVQRPTFEDAYRALAG